MFGKTSIASDLFVEYVLLNTSLYLISIPFISCGLSQASVSPGPVAVLGGDIAAVTLSGSVGAENKNVNKVNPYIEYEYHDIKCV